MMVNPLAPEKMKVNNVEKLHGNLHVYFQSIII